MTTTMVNPGADDWLNTGVFACRSQKQAAPEVVLSAQQFRRLPIPALTIIRQPYPGHTLINIDTNFLTTPTPAILTTRILGQPVRVRATPARYHWTYGDGEWLTTTNPGDYYPHMPTAHTYRQPGTFTVALTTTYTGEYSVAGQPWQPVNGTAEVTSHTITITAEERHAVLIG